MQLKAEERDRYSRHLALSEIGESGQEKLLSSSVLIVGAGGLGSPVAFYLAAAGIGTIGIMDVRPSRMQQPFNGRFCIPPQPSARKRLIQHRSGFWHSAPHSPFTLTRSDSPTATPCELSVSTISWWMQRIHSVRNSLFQGPAMQPQSHTPTAAYGNSLARQ